MEKQTVKAYQEFSEDKFTKRVIYKKGESTAFVLNFLPGQKLPNHKHPGTEVYLYTICGNGTLTIEGANFETAEADLVHCSGEEELAFENTGKEPVSLYVVLNKLPGEAYAKNI